MFICSGVSAPGREGKGGWPRPLANHLAVPRLWGVAASRKEDQCLFLAALIALKYPALEVPAISRMCEVSFFLAALAALWYSRRRIVRWGVHQGLE